MYLFVWYLTPQCCKLSVLDCVYVPMTCRYEIHFALGLICRFVITTYVWKCLENNIWMRFFRTVCCLGPYILYIKNIVLLNSQRLMNQRIIPMMPSTVQRLMGTLHSSYWDRFISYNSGWNGCYWDSSLCTLQIDWQLSWDICTSRLNHPAYNATQNFFLLTRIMS